MAHSGIKYNPNISVVDEMQGQIESLVWNSLVNRVLFNPCIKVTAIFQCEFPLSRSLQLLLDK